MKKTITLSENKKKYQLKRNVSSSNPSDLSIKMILDFSKAYSHLTIGCHSIKGIVLN